MSYVLTEGVNSDVADNTITDFLVLKKTSTGVDVATAGTQAIVGVAVENANIGGQYKPCDYQYRGIVKCIASGIIAVGALVTATTGGKIVTTTTNARFIVGRALEAASANNDIISVQLLMCTLSHV